VLVYLVWMLSNVLQVKINPLDSGSPLNASLDGLRLNTTSLISKQNSFSDNNAVGDLLGSLSPPPDSGSRGESYLHYLWFDFYKVSNK